MQKEWEAQVHDFMGRAGGHERSIESDPSQDHPLFPAPTQHLGTQEPTGSPAPPPGIPRPIQGRGSCGGRRPEGWPPLTDCCAPQR